MGTNRTKPCEQAIERLGQLLAMGITRAHLQMEPRNISVNQANETTDPVLNLFEHHKELSRPEIVELTSLSQGKAYRAIKNLLKTKKIISVGQARATRYRRT
jgi:hypothetical protein